MQSISTRIELIKSEFRLNNAELAKYADCSKQAVGNWILKEAIPSQEAAMNLRARLGISDEWLIRGKGPMKAGDTISLFTQELRDLEGSLDDSAMEAVLQVARSLAKKNNEQQ